MIMTLKMNLRDFVSDFETGVFDLGGKNIHQTLYFSNENVLQMKQYGIKFTSSVFEIRRSWVQTMLRARIFFRVKYHTRRSTRFYL